METYVRAWQEHDEAARRRLLEASWTADGVYTDPTGTIEGRDALVDAIADLHRRRRGVASVPDDSGIDGQRRQSSWRERMPSGTRR
jgi:hypothetical protein